MSEITVELVVQPSPIVVNLVAQAPIAFVPINLEFSAWIETNGDDSTGVVGNPAFPFLTLQAAFDAGAKTFNVGEGTFAGITITTPETISVAGQGFNRSIVTLVRSTADLTLQDVGFLSVEVSSIDSSGVVGADGENGTDAANLTLINTYSPTVNLAGGEGGASIGDGTGGNGGNAGMLTGENVIITTALFATGGMGGAGSTANANGGNGGDAKFASLRHSTVANAMFGAGLGGLGGGFGVNGSDGAGNAIQGEFSTITALNINTVSDLYSANFSYLPTVVGGTQGITNVSKINGAFVP